ncbi:MAG: fibronectin type III domain-containing protein, partial [Eubacterium sp.]|nr:fibronectin type III domain-containing protein [Eubacterium sp.]
MKKKLSIIFAFMVLTMCTAFAFHAYAEEVTDVSEETPAAPIVITNENTVFTLNADSFTYNASEIKPIPTVTYTDENGAKILLNKDVDYDVAYSNNINVGTATAKIEFKDKYTGTLSKKFTIKPISITGKTFSVSLGYTSTAYTGKELKPAVKVSWNNNGKAIQLINNTDYTVQYSANKNIGKATVTISGKKNFNGTIKKTFNIIPQKVTGVKCKAKTTNSITLGWNKITNISGYQILMYDKAKKAYVQVKRVPANQTSLNVTKLNTSEAYCFRIRAYKVLSDGKTNYYGAYHGYTTT